MTAARAAWRAAQAGLDPDRLVFVDETWVKSNMTPAHGWGPTRRRVVEAVPHGHWKTTTFVAALRSDGLVAPMVVDGAITGDLFVAYVEQVLAPALKAGDVVVMDNLACHKVAKVAPAVEKAGAVVVYLPAYSPDLNPIEQAFAKAKGGDPAAEAADGRRHRTTVRRRPRLVPPRRVPQLHPARRVRPTTNRLKML